MKNHLGNLLLKGLLKTNPKTGGNPDGLETEERYPEKNGSVNDLMELALTKKN